MRTSLPSWPPPLLVGTPEVRGGVVRLELGGDLDLATAEILDGVLDAAMDRHPSSRIVEVSLSRVEFCDVSGLNALIRNRARLRHGGVELRLVDPQRQLLRLLAIAGVPGWTPDGGPYDVANEGNSHHAGHTEAASIGSGPAAAQPRDRLH